MRLTIALIAVYILGAAEANTYGCTDYNNNHYPVGRIDNYGNNKCQECTCNAYGRIECENKDDYGPFPGGETCEECFCLNGHEACNAVACEPIYCPEEYRYREYGACCDTCRPNCEYGGNHYDVGATVDKGNPCEDCTCAENGDVVCSAKYGELASTQPCELCSCVNGHRACNQVGCPDLDCPPEFRYREPGSCCDECRRACTRGYDWYNVGDKVDRGDKCEDCVCSDSYDVQCQHVPCERLPCYPSQYVMADGACCEHCPEGCQVGYAYYLTGEKFDSSTACEECTCDYGGQVNCGPKPCPPLYCPNQYTPSGECCPICREY